MTFDTLWFYIFAFFTAFQAARGIPLTQYTVQLSTCRAATDAVPLSEKCTSVCEPIRIAQETCEQGLPCTCDAAPPAVVQACFQCHSEVNEEYSTIESFARAISLYTELCDSDILSSATAEFDEELLSSKPNPTAEVSHLAQRERTEEVFLPCIYGVPSFTLQLPPQSSLILLDKKLFVFVVFCIAVVVCIIDRRRK